MVSDMKWCAVSNERADRRCSIGVLGTQVLCSCELRKEGVGHYSILHSSMLHSAISFHLLFPQLAPSTSPLASPASGRR